MTYNVNITEYFIATIPEDSDDLVARIIADQESNIRHAPIKVARHANPFQDEASEETFWTVFNGAWDLAPASLPNHLKLHDADWDEGEYPTYENLVVGRRKKSVRVELPPEVWRPRAERWCLAVNVLTRILDMSSDSSSTSDTESE